MISSSNFTKKDTLENYISITHDGKEFICDTCSSKFKQKARLEMYIEIDHRGKKLLKCDICIERFSDKSNLRKHFKLIHKEISFKCNICDCTFLNMVT